MTTFITLVSDKLVPKTTFPWDPQLAHPNLWVNLSTSVLIILFIGLVGWITWLAFDKKTD